MVEMARTYLKEKNFPSVLGGGNIYATRFTYLIDCPHVLCQGKHQKRPGQD